jgi:YtkA-like
VPNSFLKHELLRWLAALACAATLLEVGCSRPVEPPPLVAIEHEISPEPARVGPATVALRLSDATGKPITGARIAIEADMSHAGMSPFFADAKETERGRYQAQVEFQMAGDWVILLHVTLPGGNKVERQIDVRGVGPGVQSGVRSDVQSN